VRQEGQQKEAVRLPQHRGGEGGPRERRYANRWNSGSLVYRMPSAMFEIGGLVGSH